MKATTTAVQIFGGRYGECPRRPDGFKWMTHQRSRMSSCAWGFDTFAAALRYARQQYARAVAETAAREFSGAEYCEREFWATISGPGGEMAWDVIKPLVIAS